MKVLPQMDRGSYLDMQVERSRQKFKYNKVSYRHARAIVDIALKNDCAVRSVCCLGVRNGREVDLFRYAAFHQFLGRLASIFEVKKCGYTSLFPVLERFGRSSCKLDHSKITNVALGVEINPDNRRRDVFNGSFDDLPEKWEDSFDLIYTNSFDQSQDPHRSVKEWLRILKPGGIMVIDFDGSAPNEHDPIGDITPEDIKNLFPLQCLVLTERLTKESRYQTYVGKKSR